ncbi:copper chaperone PCu(A)C [Modestobacter sp. NPDC049651]|uniref:copper chaperone PCu(A)C n=1 Tax=unclassified Modestobacter TaxID=2643866 RepID=UPI0033D2BAA9
MSRALIATRACAAAIALTTTLCLAGCGEGNLSGRGEGEMAGGAIGPDESASEQVELLQVQLEYPLDGSYAVGDDARLFLGISNIGEQADRLLGISGDAFTDVAVDGADADGAALLDVPAGDVVHVGAEGGPAITLLDLQRPLRSSQSIPVTFAFRDAGEVTVDAMVAAEGQRPSPTYDFPRPTGEPSS